MPVVAMPDGTQVQFPDDMPADNIKSLIARKFPGEVRAAEKSGMSTVEKAVEPLTSYPSTQGQMARDALAQMGSGAGQVKDAISYAVNQPRGEQSAQQAVNLAKGVGNVAMGGLSYVFSPISAGLRTIVGKPIEENTGIPKEYTEFAGAFALPGAIAKVGEAGRLLKSPASKAPSVDELKTVASAGYESPAVTGFEAKPSVIRPLADAIEQDLFKGRANEISAPTTFKILGKLKEAPPDTVAFTGDNIESLRRAFGDVTPVKDATGKVINGADIRAAKIAQNRIDEFLPKIEQTDVLAGNPKAAADTLAEARANYSAAEGAATIDRKTVRAELRAAAANSGRNMSNTMRQRIADILLDPAQMRGYSQNEIALMNQIVRGGKVENAIRYAGNFLGGGGGLGAMLTTAEGIKTLGPVGVALSLPGAALKSLSNAITMKNIDRLNEMIRADSPLGRQMIGPVREWGQSVERASAAPNPRNIAMLTLASRNLANNLKGAGIEVTPADLLRAVQGAEPSRANQEQP